MLVSKGRNLHRIGWKDGVALVAFRSGSQWEYGPGVPREDVEKIIRNPFPDRLFQLLIKSKFPAKKVA